MANPVNNADVIKYSAMISRETDKNGKKVDTVPVSITFDFTGVSRSALISEAMRNIMVKKAGATRSMTTKKENPLSWKAAIATLNGQTVNVLEFLKNTRTVAKTPEAKAKRIAKGSENADKATLQEAIRLLQSQLAGKK